MLDGECCDVIDRSLVSSGNDIELEHEPSGVVNMDDVSMLSPVEHEPL